VPGEQAVADLAFHEEASAEYHNAIRWYEQRSKRAAFRFEDEVERVLGAIISNPELFPRYDAENHFALLKRFPYSVVYQVYENRIYVIAIAHSSRAPEYWRGRQ
jgi:plasmid stabilization system protein ParE